MVTATGNQQRMKMLWESHDHRQNSVPLGLLPPAVLLAILPSRVSTGGDQRRLRGCAGLSSLTRIFGMAEIEVADGAVKSFMDVKPPVEKT